MTTSSQENIFVAAVWKKKMEQTLCDIFVVNNVGFMSFGNQKKRNN
jgi:hypothetical protein